MCLPFYTLPLFKRMVLPFLFIIFLILIYGTLSVYLFKNQKQARNLQPPETQVALRGPGESLRVKMDMLLEKLTSMVCGGACATVIIAAIPAFVLHLRPEANVWFLLGSILALFIASSIWVVTRLISLMHERSNARLGWLGETIVAEHLQACQSSGFQVFHDVPLNVDGYVTNIDHVAFGPKGVVVIETKMRSKPANHQGGQITVEYDGKRLSWPRFPNDTKTIWQVRKNAENLEHLIRTECGFSVQVKQVIAIPGWMVVEKLVGQPRVVSGKGVSDAVIQCVGDDDSALLSRAQVESIRKMLEVLCKDVTL